MVRGAQGRRGAWAGEPGVHRSGGELRDQRLGRRGGRDERSWCGRDRTRACRDHSPSERDLDRHGRRRGPGRTGRPRRTDTYANARAWARRPRGAALHLGYNRQAQGSDAEPPQPARQRHPGRGARAARSGRPRGNAVTAVPRQRTGSDDIDPDHDRLRDRDVGAILGLQVLADRGRARAREPVGRADDPRRGAARPRGTRGQAPRCAT